MEIIVLFDGVCNLCSGVVRWILPRNPQANIRFAALQSHAGQQLTARHGIDSHQLDSIVVITAAGAYTASDAALEMSRHLCWPWRWAYPLRIIPRRWRDAVYAWVARNRYRWFGVSEKCLLNMPEYHDRFIPD
jgi:predicted DCC family thiol-disulfide oxidoreductase YuxK